MIVIFLRIARISILIATISAMLLIWSRGLVCAMRCLRTVRRRQIMEIMHGGSGLAAIVHLDVESARIIQAGLGAHGAVVSEAGFAAANDDI